MSEDGEGAGWSQILLTDERLLWSGRPHYGRRLFEPVGTERTYHICFIVGVAAMWSSVPLIERTGSLTIQDAIWVYGVVSALFLLSTYLIAVLRSGVLDSVHYAVTDQRAIVRRDALNYRLSPRTYVVSFPYEGSFPYDIVKNRPLDCLTIGYLLSEDVVQPFGFGLTHPGWPVLRNRGVCPVFFEQLDDLMHVRGLIERIVMQAAQGQRDFSL